MKIFYSWQELVEMKARDAAGINSPHNACQFRTDCRKAEAEIARLRERLEVTYAYDLSGKRIDVLAGSIPDGIACRDETIKMQDAKIARLREDAARKYKQAKEYIEKMDAVIDDCGIAKSCINPLEDLKRAVTALKERAEKAEAALDNVRIVNEIKKELM